MMQKFFEFLQAFWSLGVGVVVAIMVGAIATVGSLDSNREAVVTAGVLITAH